MLNIGVLVSGGGTNLQALIDNINCGFLGGCRISVVISSRKNAYALERASNAGIPSFCIIRKDYNEPEDYDKAIISKMEEHDVELVVMAGFLSILGKLFISAYAGRVINIHPSLIPSFCGKGFYGIIPHQKAIEYGVKLTGATVHFVELDTDAGPIILQKAIEVLDEDTPESLQQRVMSECEQQILPMAVRLFAEGKLVIEGRRVRTIRSMS